MRFCSLHTDNNPIKIHSFIYISLLWMLDIDSAESAVLRTTRDLLSFSMMTTLKTGRSAFDFNNYGRYCGVQGSGKPADGIDMCCSLHDKCYNKATGHSGVCNAWGTYGPYWIKYKWKSDENSTITCEFTNPNVDRFAECGYEICKCDKAIATCFAGNSYNPNNQKTLLWRILENKLISTFNLTTT